MKSEVFPVGLLLGGRECLVVGSGDECLGRTRALLLAGARLHVVSERPDDEVRNAAAAGQLALSIRRFEDSDLDGVWFAVLADQDRALAERMASIAEARRVFFCAVDQPDFGSFSHLAQVRSGPVTVAISTNGRAPSLARRLREELARVFAEADLAGFAERVARLRDRTKSADRRAVLGEAVQGVRFAGNLVLPPPKPDPSDQRP